MRRRPYFDGGCGGSYTSTAGGVDAMPQWTVNLNASYYVTAVQIWTPALGLQKARPAPTPPP